MLVSLSLNITVVGAHAAVCLYYCFVGIPVFKKIIVFVNKVTFC